MFHPLHWTTWKKCQLNSQDNFVLPRVTGVLSTSEQPLQLWGTIFFRSGTRQYWGCLYQSWTLHIHFVCHYILSNTGWKFPFLESVFSVSGICWVSTTVSVVFSGEVFGVVSTTSQSSKLIFNWMKRFLLSPMFQHILTRKKN